MFTTTASAPGARAAANTSAALAGVGGSAPAGADAVSAGDTAAATPTARTTAQVAGRVDILRSTRPAEDESVKTRETPYPCPRSPGAQVAAPTRRSRLAMRRWSRTGPRFTVS